MFPIFDYYCPDHERHPIPDDPVLNVENTVNLNVTKTLQEILTGKSGVWLLLWQDDIVDPHHIVLDLLLSQGTELPIAHAFHGVNIRHIQLSSKAQFTWESAVILPANIRWQHGIVLVEARANRLAFKHGETLQLTLYWRTEMPLKDSYTVFTHVARGETHTQHDGIPANGTRPTNTWRVGEIIEDRHIISIPSWLPAGEYELQVGLYNYAAEGMPRLSAVDEVGRELDSYVILSQVRVLPDIL